MTDTDPSPATCPSCGAPVTLRPDTEGFRCDYCHAAFHPDSDDDSVLIASDSDPAGLACPICSLSLVKASIAKTPILYCNQCHGILLPMPVLESVISDLRARTSRPAVQTPPDRGDLKRTTKCPNCHRRMDTHFYSGPGNVIVDSCDNCLLIWFDRGELTRIARAPDEKMVENPTWS